MKHSFKALLIFLLGGLTISVTPNVSEAAWNTSINNPVGTISNVLSPTKKNAVAYYGSKYFATVEAAVNSANSSGSSQTVYVIPGANPTITTSFTINSNITLALPYDGTTYYTDPTTSNNTLVLPDNSTYMKSKVTLAAGVTITNNGTIYVGGTIGAGNGGGQNGGQTCGNYAQLTMRDGSILNCESGSKVYVYGYITEQTKHAGDYADDADISSWPTINMKSGSLMNAPFVLHDFRGGSITSGLYGDRSSKHVIFFNEYEIRNIKPMINFSYGSQLTVNTWLYASNSAYSSKDIKLIGNSNAYLFQMNSGSTINFKYNYGNTTTTHANRWKNFMDIRLRGSFAINSLTLNVAGTSLDTSNYRFALSYLYHLRFYEGSATISNMAKLMGGAKVIVYPGASLTLGDTIVYEGYVDGTDGHAQYPTEAGEPLLVNNGTLTASKLAGPVYTENNTATLSVTTASITSYEHLSHSGSSLFTTTTYTTINGDLKLKLLKNGMISSNFSTVSGGTYYSYEDTNNNCGWYANSGTISYNTNGSSDTFSSKNISIVSGGYILTASDLSNTPTRLHYTFGGWYMDDTLTEQATVGTSIYSSITLYAKWTPTNYSVVYNFNLDASGNPVSGTPTNNSNNPSTYNIESSYILYPATFGDYIFDGWYTDSSYTNRITSITGDVLSSLSSPYTLNLYGRWFDPNTETYTITYVNSNTDEGCTCMASETVLSATLSSYSPPDLSGLNSDTTYGKYFDGWYTDSTYQTKYTSYTQITGSMSLYALWQNKNLVTASLAGNDLFSVSRYLNKNSTFTIPNASSYIDIPTGYEIEWTVSGGDLSGNTYHTGDTITLSSTWGQTINVVGNVVAKSWTLTIKIGTNETATYSIARGGSTIVPTTNIAANGTATVSVKTGDVVTVTVTPSSNYTAGSVTTSNVTGSKSPFTISGAGTPSITYGNATSSGGGCLLPDTLITMADGTKKAVKDIVAGDMVLVMNHETGELDVAPITFNDHEEEALVTVLNAVFSDGTTVGVVYEHGFFDMDTKRYEYLSEDTYQDLIGDRFIKEDGSLVTLVDVEIEERYTEIYSPTSFFHFNYFTEDMLSMPGGITGLFNIFEYGDNLQYDQEKYEQDIATYGLFTYDDLAPLGVTEVMFDAYAGKYLKVALGKGILTEEYLAYLIDRYGGFTE